MSEILVADIGGSKSRFALVDAGGRPARMALIENDTVPNLEAAVAGYLEQTKAQPRRAVFAVAGPIGGDEIALTNRAWRFERNDLARRFGFASLEIVNDFEAIAWSLPRLSAEETCMLGSSAGPQQGMKVVLGPGTGLGVAAIFPAQGRWHVIPSEGGHASFGPQLADELEPFARMREQLGSLSAEMVISGPGLLRLARVLDRLSPHETPEAVIAGALAGDSRAIAATTLFIRLLGRFAGGVALAFKAMGGVYIAGGVGHGLAPLLKRSEFRTAFEAHPPHTALLKMIPTLLITVEEPGLIGCAALAQMSAWDSLSPSS
jgi:glucokinase